MRPDEGDLDEEIRGHLAINIKERIDRGESPASARRAALMEFGYVPAVRDEMRRVWYSRWYDQAEALVRDLRFALRSLSRAKALTATVVVTLALGIGANAAIFSVVRSVLLRPLVNREADRLIYLRQDAQGLGIQNLTFSVPEITDFKSRATTIAAFGDFSTVEFTLIGFASEPRLVRAGVVNGSFFEVMGLRPALGRLLGPGDDGPGAAGAAVLTHRFWKDVLRSDPTVIGSELYYRAQHEFAAHGVKIEGLGFDIAAMQKRKGGIVKQMTQGILSLFKGAGVTPLTGHGRLLAGNEVEFTGPGGAKRSLQAKHVVLASGSEPMPLRGVAFDGERIVDSWGALEFPEVPKRLCVIGAGVIGLELGSVWRRLGADTVVLEALEQFLPMADGALAKEAARHFKKQGLDIRLGAKVSSASIKPDGVHVSYTDAKGAQTLVVDRLIVAIGRRPFTRDLLGEGTGVVLDERGFIQVDEHCKTGAADVWAIGDCVRGPMLAHKGKEEGVAVADQIAGLYGHVNYNVIPSVIYTAPEIAWVGQTEEQAKAAGRNIKSGNFPFAASGRAKAMEAGAGFCKVVADAATDEILGIHIIGPMAGELIAEAVLAMEYSASSEDLQRTIHAHPTLSEAVHEAALAADKRAIDIPNR